MFNVKSDLSLWTTQVSMRWKPPTRDTKGTLEMQKMVLQGLARKESVANVLSLKLRSMSQADLNDARKEACMVL
jgi:hypothetical protein